jgi:hypothetical protein
LRITGVAALLALALAVPAAAQTKVPPPLGARAQAQIRALQHEKASRTPAQRKIASRLLHASRMRRGQPVAEGIPTLRSRVAWAADGTTLVDLRADVSPALLDAIAAHGGRVVSAFARYGAVRAHLPAAALEAIAARADVKSLRPADLAFVRKVDTSEGDVAHRADDLRVLESVDGSGVTVGVLSDGIGGLGGRQGTGDLPVPVTILPGQNGTGSEGTAMLEIVYDLAPGASLMFATAFTGQANFATNILALASAGADVIVDDVGYFAEPVFQDGIIAAAIDTVTAAGVLYVSAAGNDGNLSSSSSGVWEGDFVDSGSVFSGNPLHLFALGAADTVVTADSPDVFSLKWSDELGASGNDYDLYLFDDTGNTLLDSSVNFQDGDDDPYEEISSMGFDDSGNRLAVAQYVGATRVLSLNTHGGELEFSTASQLFGHPGARGAMAVAATDWILAGGAGGEFDGSESVQFFSSDGPRRVHYEEDGTPITPGNFSSTGGELRAKPDVTAADCVSTSTPGYGVFCGTSAAAPHVAAIAALLLELGGGGTTAADVRDALEQGTLDIGAAGHDRDAGHGIVEAVAAAAVLLPEPGAAAMLGAGALLIAGLERRRRRSRGSPRA